MNEGEKMKQIAFHYNSTRQERHYSDLNQRVETALRNNTPNEFYMEGGAWLGGDGPKAADNWVIFEDLNKEEINHVKEIIEGVVDREVALHAE